jgi:hypothetical protein
MLTHDEITRLAELHRQIRQGFGFTPEERTEARRLEHKASADQLQQIPFTPAQEA